MTHALCDGVHAASGGIDATAAIKPDSLSWGAGIECEAAKGGPSGVTGGDRTGTRQRWQQPACREREGTHALGAIFEAVIEEPAVIQRILTHLGPAAQPPPRAPALLVNLFEAA